MNRRDFLNFSLSATGTFAWSSLIPLQKLLAASQTILKHQLITIRIPGGWDTSLCMDPWTNDQRPPQDQFFIEYRKDELVQVGDRFFGPSLAPLKPYLDRASIVNGVYLSGQDNGHDAAQLYIETGSGEGHLGSFPVELEGLAFDSKMGVAINSGVQMGHRMASVWDVSRTLANKKIEPADLIFNDEPSGSFIDLAKNALINNGDRITRFNQSIEGAGRAGELTLNDIVSVGFRTGLSQSASLVLTTFLDTHSNHPKTHHDILVRGFTEIKTLLDILKATPSYFDASASLLDTTTIIVFSEFTRTPALNASQGKDHNPQSNSMLIFSPLLKPKTVGTSHLVPQAKSKTGRPLLAATPLHRQSFQPMEERADSFILRPENVYSTLLTAMGINPTKLSPNFEDSLILKPLLSR